jgi:hypothetical protein
VGSLELKASGRGADVNVRLVQALPLFKGMSISK